MSTRSCIVAAAFSVKVRARIWCGFARPDAMSWTIRAVRTWVFPVPAPATMSRGPSPCSTAPRCSAVSPLRISGRSSPSGKESCSVTDAPRRAAAFPQRLHPNQVANRSEPVRSSVLFYPAGAAGSGAGEPLRERDERADRRTLWAFRGERSVLVAPVGTGDVEVGPLGAVLDRGIEERRGLDRATLAAGAVGEVGDVALDLVAVLIGQWHRPEAVAGFGAGAPDLVDERVGLPEEAAEVVAERDRDRAGERGDVHDAGRALALGVADPVDQDQTPFGVGVDHLDRLAAHAREHVAGLRSPATGKVLGAWRDGDHVD